MAIIGGIPHFQTYPLSLTQFDMSLLSLSEVGSRTAGSPTAPPHGWHRGRLADERRRMCLGWWKTNRTDRLLMFFWKETCFFFDVYGWLVLFFFWGFLISTCHSLDLPNRAETCAGERSTRRGQWNDSDESFTNAMAPEFPLVSRLLSSNMKSFAMRWYWMAMESGSAVIIWSLLRGWPVFFSPENWVHFSKIPSFSMWKMMF